MTRSYTLFWSVFLMVFLCCWFLPHLFSERIPLETIKAGRLTLFAQAAVVGGLFLGVSTPSPNTGGSLWGGKDSHLLWFYGLALFGRTVSDCAELPSRWQPDGGFLVSIRAFFSAFSGGIIVWDFLYLATDFEDIVNARCAAKTENCNGQIVWLPFSFPFRFHYPVI